RYRAWIRHIHEFYRPPQRGGEARQRAAGWRCAQALQWAASSPHAGLGYLVRQALRAKWDLSVSILSDAIAALRPYRGGSADEAVAEVFRRIRQEVDRQATTGDVEDIEDETSAQADLDRESLESLLREGVELVGREPDQKWWFIK